MLFISKWTIHPGQIKETYKVFSQMPAGDDVGDGGDKITLIGRWHDLAAGTGVAVFECEDPSAMAAWALNWSDGMDVEITPVVDDETAKAIGGA
jgi:hypothetical protein